MHGVGTGIVVLTYASVSEVRMGWRDATFALFSMEQGKSDKHSES